MIFDLPTDPKEAALIRVALGKTRFDWERLRPGLRDQTGKRSISVRFGFDRPGTVEALSSGRAHMLAQEEALGLAWTDGAIDIAAPLKDQPQLAGEVFMAEAAHMIDFFLLTDSDREQISSAFGTSGWWEGAYEDQVGEAFMGAFIAAFTEFEPTLEPLRQLTPKIIETVRTVLTPSMNPLIRS